MRPYSTQYYTFFRSSHLSKKRCKLKCYPMTGFEHDGIFHKFYVRNWCGRIGCKGRWDETGRDGMGWACGPHTRTECIYLSIYLLIESQSRLKFNGPTHPSLHTTSCSGWGYKRQWPLHAHPPPLWRRKNDWALGMWATPKSINNCNSWI
jgi:hypothetical protein